MSDFSQQIIVCDSCKNTMMKATAKNGPQGILCSRCHPYADGYIQLPRFGDVGFEIATKINHKAGA